MKVRCFSNPLTSRRIKKTKEQPWVKAEQEPAAPSSTGILATLGYRASSSSSRSCEVSSRQSKAFSTVSAEGISEHDLFVSEEASTQAPFWDIPEPLNVCILVVGTLGDVQPFVAIGEILRDHGHRVRIGTHSCYEKLVLDHNLEFAPLAGDPAELSEFMVKHGGLLKPMSVGGMVKDMPHQTQVQKEIMESTWPAACSGDFRANAVIANPVCWGHVHVAEALECPLHIMFPQPWVPTREFPHPATGWSVGSEPSSMNKWSFKMTEALTWYSLASDVNKWRAETLGLPPVSSGEGAKGIIKHRRVPFSFLGSAALVARPRDWPAHADIVGGVSMPEAPYTPSPALAAFLAAGPPPLLITFGSMRIARPARLAQRIVAAARRCGARVIVQSGWSNLAEGAEEDPLVFQLGKAPHSWLIPRVAAVVHHGGAGTTYAVAKAGKPSMVCPFFGDQPFWAACVDKTGAALPSVPIAALTEDRLAEAFARFRSGELEAAAEALQARVLAEGDGAANAVLSFYRQL